MNSKLDHNQDWPVLAREAKWHAPMLAKKCGVSARTLDRYFRKNMGESVKTWLTNQRHCLALELLHDGVSVKAAALELGYGSAHYFSESFKKRYGCRPTQINQSRRRKTGRKSRRLSVVFGRLDAVRVAGTPGRRRHVLEPSCVNCNMIVTQL